MTAENTKDMNGRAVQKIKLGQLDEDNEGGRNLLNGSLELIQGLKVRLSVTLGRSEMTVGELMDAREGSVVTLDKGVQEPVDVVLDGKVIARGTLVAVGDSFGVRITEVLLT